MSVEIGMVPTLYVFDCLLSLSLLSCFQTLYVRTPNVQLWYNICTIVATFIILRQKREHRCVSLLRHGWTLSSTLRLRDVPAPSHTQPTHQKKRKGKQEQQRTKEAEAVKPKYLPRAPWYEGSGRESARLTLPRACPEPGIWIPSDQRLFIKPRGVSISCIGS